MSVVVIKSSSVLRRGARASGRAGLAASVALGAGLALSLAGGAGAAGSAVPFSDTNAVGTIGLCNAQGQQISSGSVTTAPFAWRAVSTSPATGAYAGASRTAILYAYQPIKGLAPSDWSGAQLTASSRYSNPANPMAAATGGDNSLAAFMRDFAPQWDGYLQLRIYLGAANEQPDEVHYPTLDIQVTGSTWHAVDGQPVNCDAGTAESIESILLPASDLRQPSSSSSGSAADPSGSSSGAAAGGSAAGATQGQAAQTSPSPAGASSAPTASGQASHASAASHLRLYVGGGALVVALGLFFGVFLRRRRRRRRRRRGGRTGAAAPGSVVDPPTASESAPEPRTLAVTSTKGISS